MLIELTWKLLLFTVRCLLFSFFASFVQTDIKICLFCMDTHQKPECRRSLITCWDMEGSQYEIVKLLAMTIQGKGSAQHMRSVVEGLPVTDFTAVETDTGKAVGSSASQTFCARSHSRTGTSFSSCYCVLSTQHLLNTE